jgi:hypothetical protein
MRNEYTILVGNLDGRHHLQDLGADGRIILESIVMEMKRKTVTSINQSQNRISGGNL